MKGLKFNFILIAVFLISFGLISSSYASAVGNVKKGQKEFEKGKYDKAIEQFMKNETVKVTDNNYPIYQLNLATALWVTGDYNGAKKALDNASTQIWGPKSTWGSFQEVGLGLKNESKTKWIGQESERIYVRFYTGLCHLLNKEYDDAIVEFKRCISINNQYPIVHYFMGIASREIEDENAKVCFKWVDSLSANPYSNLELMYLEAQGGNKDDAHARYEKIKSNIADNPGASNLEDILKNGSNLCLLIEKGHKTKWDSKGSIKIKIGDQDYGQSYFLDSKGNRQSFKSDMAQFALGYAGQLGRDMLSNAAANAVPGGGIVLGLFMGKERDQAIKTWLLLPDIFRIYETYLAPGDYQIIVESIDKKGKLLKSVTKNVTISKEMAIVPLYL